MIKIPPFTRWVLLGLFPARRSRFRVSHYATNCARRSFTSYRPAVHTCSHFGARVCRRHMLCETSTFWRRTSPLPMGLSSRRRMLLLASHCMVLTKERKTPSRIAREIEIYSIFAWLVPKLVPNITRFFEYSAANLLITMIYKHLWGS